LSYRFIEPNSAPVLEQDAELLAHVEQVVVAMPGTDSP
jgi:hypothetical protein